MSVFTLFLVELVHGDVDAGKGEGLDAGDGVVYDWVEDFTLFGGELAEHVVYLSSAAELVAYAYAQTGVFLSDELLYVSQSVVSSVGAVPLEAHLAEREGQFVYDDEQPLGGDVLFLKPLAHGVAGEVHVCRRFQQEQFPAFYRGFSNEAVTLVGEGRPEVFGELVDDHPSGVVPCLVIFRSGIAESGDKEFVHFCSLVVVLSLSIMAGAA